MGKDSLSQNLYFRHMHRITIFILILIFLGCKKEAKNSSDEIMETKVLFTFQGLPNVVTLNTNAKEIASDWVEYQEFRHSLDVLFNSTTNEDLELAIENLIENEKKLTKGSFPSEFDHNKIKSRIKVNRTFLLKIQADLQNRKDASTSIRQMIDAHNALQGQLNLMVNNPINLDSIFNEN